MGHQSKACVRTLDITGVYMITNSDSISKVLYKFTRRGKAGDKSQPISGRKYTNATTQKEK